MVKKSKSLASEEGMTNWVIDSAHQIWLAGLGAFSKAGEEGSKLFDTLVKEGAAIESHSKKSVKVKTKKTTTKTADAWNKLEEAFETRVSGVINRLGVPTLKDIEELSKRVEKLDKSISALSKSASPRSRRTTSRRTSTKR